jgi:hypothetical protein
MPSETFIIYVKSLEFTPWSEVLEKLIVAQLVTNFPNFYWTGLLIIV